MLAQQISKQYVETTAGATNVYFHELLISCPALYFLFEIAVQSFKSLVGLQPLIYIS